MSRRAAPGMVVIALVVGSVIGGGPGAGALEPLERTPGRLAVFDGAGSRLGPVVVPDPPGAWVMLEATEPPVAVRVEADRIVRGTTTVGFESADCSGTPWLLDLRGPLLMFLGFEAPRLLSGVGPDDVLYVEDGPGGDRTLVATWNPRATPPCRPMLLGAGPESTLAARPLLALSAVPPPFGLPAPGAARQAHRVPSLLDAGDQVVGQVVGHLDLSSSPLLDLIVLAVRLPGGGDPFLVFASGDRFAAGAGFVGYEAGGCAGPPLLPAGESGAPGLFPASGLGPDGRLYGADGPLGPVAVASLWNPLATPADCLSLPGMVVRAAPAAPGPDLGGHPPPFRLALAGPGPAARDAAGGLTLLDAEGRPLGPLYVTSLGAGLVALRAGGRVLLARAGRAGFTGGSHPALFESATCSGPLLIEDDEELPGGPRLLPPTALGPGGVLHVQEVGPAAIVFVQSRYNAAPTPSCVVSAPTRTRVAPATPVLDLGAIVVPLASR